MTDEPIDPEVFRKAARAIEEKAFEVSVGPVYCGWVYSCCQEIIEASYGCEFDERPSWPYTDLFAEYFKPRAVRMYWWDFNVYEERILALYLMAEIAEDLKHE